MLVSHLSGGRESGLKVQVELKLIGPGPASVAAARPDRSVTPFKYD